MTEPMNTSPGTNVWFDLPTSDREAAKEFYEKLFGWQWIDVQMDDPHMKNDATCSFAMMDGKHVGAIFTEHEGLRKPDGMPMWMHHFWSEDAQKTHDLAVEMGGESLIEPYEIPNAGIKTVVTTPEGAPFVVWSAEDDFGTDCFGAINAACWTEYYTRDVEGSYRFFEQVLGIKFKKEQFSQVQDPQEKYDYHTMIMGGDTQSTRAGMLPMDEQWGDMKSHFMLYFAVQNCEETAELAKQLGGEICVPPTDIPPGKFAVLSDPQGRTFSIIRLNPDPQA